MGTISWCAPGIPPLQLNFWTCLRRVRNPTLSAKTARNTLKIKNSEEVSYKAYLIGHVDQRRHVANTKRRPAGAMALIW